MANWPIHDILRVENGQLCTGRVYGVAVMDIDFFTRFCKKFCQQDISDIIKNITLFLESQLPLGAALWKSEGDEFLIFAPDYDATGLQCIITEVKKKFRKQRFARNSRQDYSNVAMTFSAGVASFPRDGDTLDALVKKATVALFLAKAFRRDRVLIAPHFENSGFNRILYDSSLHIDILFGRYGEYGSVLDRVHSSEALLWEPQAVCIDNEGNLYIADQNNHCVLKYDGEYVHRIAGNMTFDFSGDHGPGVKAALNKPTGLAVYEKSLYITDTGNDAVRKLDLESGLIDTFAGTGETGYSGDGGPAQKARLNKPGGAAVDRNGNVYINDIANNVIRKVNTSGIISTYAGTGKYGYSGDGGPSRDAAFSEIYSVYVDRHYNYLYLADYFNHCIRKVDLATDIITTVAGSGREGYDGDGGDACGASLSRPVAICSDRWGNLFIAESGNSCIRFVNKTTGRIYTLVGDGTIGIGRAGPVGAFRLANPNGLELGPEDKLYILDGANNRVCLMNLRGSNHYNSGS